MVKGKWVQVGAGAILSVAMLSGCGNSDEPQMKQENDMPGVEQNDSDEDDDEDDDSDED